MSKFLKKTLIISLLAVIISAVTAPLIGQAVSTGLDETAGRAGLKSQEPTVIIGTVIYFFLSALGVVLLIILVYAGFLWMTAGGDEDQVRKAKARIINGMIGLAITLMAYAITSYVVQQISTAAG
ncbi:MAG: hypothetical protein ACOZBH_00345 [Patescibacteria group bacterium]